MRHNAGHSSMQIVGISKNQKKIGRPLWTFPQSVVLKTLWSEFLNFVQKLLIFFSLLIVCMIQYDNKGIFWLKMVIDDSFMYLNKKIHCKQVVKTPHQLDKIWKFCDGILSEIAKKWAKKHTSKLLGLCEFPHCYFRIF